jgi:two-component system sensor histidine kinase/response regulator
MDNNEKLASLLKGLLDATPDLIFAKDLNYRYITHNDAFSRLVGQPGKNLSGLEDKDIFSDDNAIARLRHTDQSILASTETICAQESATYPDGTKVLLDTLKTPFYDTQGKLIGLLGISRDVTKRVAAENTANIEKEKAQQASLAKSEFLAKMSHEIRTPMNAVIGLSKLLKKTRLGEEQDDYVNKLITSSESLLSIINDILDYSKIEAKRLSIHNSPFDLQKVIDGTITICELKALEKNIELILQITSDVPIKLIGDPQRLQQVLVNLINNAIKFTEAGYVLVKISLDTIHYQAAEGRDCASLRFAIIDSGIGISAEQQEKLFSSFSQVDNSFTRQFEGTGLGLAISKQLVELMGGDIAIESHLGQGSTFSFSINLPINHEDNAAGATQDLPVDFSTLKALVVDDSSIARTIVMDMLIEKGMTVECASDGNEAIDMVVEACANQTDYDLILMDWRMPGLNGIDAAKRIKGDLGKSHIPAILLLSAYDLDEAKQVIDEVQIDAYLEKPVNAQTLLDAVVRSLTTISHPKPTGSHPKSTGSVNAAPSDCDTPNYSDSRILVVDDNAINRTVVNGYLKESRVTIDVAIDGLDALKKINSSKYDLVLMDIQMPNMDGLSATREIRKNLKHAKLPVIAMTANAMEGDTQISLDAGMNGHITKPIDPDQLYRVLNKWLQVTPGGSAKTAVPPRQSSNNPVLARLTEIEHLSVEEALHRCQGKEAFYESLVADFIKEYQDIGAELTRLFNANDCKSLFMKCHSLKANAAYIGALELAAASAQLEQAAKGNYASQKLVDDLSLMASQLLDQVNHAMLRPALVKTPVTPFSNDDLPAALLHIHPLLASSDFTVEEFMPQLVSLCRNTQYEEKVVEIDRMVANIQFERATEQCESLIKEVQQ